MCLESHLFTRRHAGHLSLEFHDVFLSEQTVGPEDQHQDQDYERDSIAVTTAEQSGNIRLCQANDQAANYRAGKVADTTQNSRRKSLLPTTTPILGYAIR